MPSIVAGAYLAVVLIWATTPMAIQWSSHDLHFLSGLTARMLIGLCLIAVLFFLTRKRLKLSVEALKVYLAGGLGIFGAMSLVYWGAGHIPSGWISVIFGLSPVFTGLMARWWLNESALTTLKILGMAFGLLGLMIIFGANTGSYPSSKTGVTLVLLSTLIHSASGVWVKKLNHSLDGLSVAFGSLAVSVPLFTVTWLLFATKSNAAEIPLQTIAAITYLGVFGSVLGFSLYYFLLTKMAASRIALITLVTPVLALLLGARLNNEPLTISVYLGALSVLAGLAMYEWQAIMRSREPSSGN